MGSLSFVESVKRKLGGKGLHRAVEGTDGACALWERREPNAGNFSGKSEPLRTENTFFWNENPAAAET